MPISDSPSFPDGLTKIRIDFEIDERLVDSPRRFRAERQRWEDAIEEEAADGRPHPDFIFDRPYLTAHPEREIAEGRGVQMHCAACDIWRTFSPFGLERGAAVAQALLSAHEHNLTRHPRRFVRSLHLDAVTRSELLTAVSTTKAARA